MTCEEYQEKVSQYVDRELGERESGILFSHLGKCSDCREFLKGLLELRSRIQDDILKEASPTTGTPWIRKRIRLSITTALVAVAVIITSTIAVVETLLRPESTGSPQVVYMMSLPIVEVQGENPNDKSINQ